MDNDCYLQCCPVFQRLLSFSRSSCTGRGEHATTPIQTFCVWLRAHENAQVMLASILVVFAIWWVVRCILSLLINIVCPILVVLLAVICVPQLRYPLLGQNYPLVAKTLQSILLKMAENINTSTS